MIVMTMVKVIIIIIIIIIITLMNKKTKNVFLIDLAVPNTHNLAKIIIYKQNKTTNKNTEPNPVDYYVSG